MEIKRIEYGSMSLELKPGESFECMQKEYVAVEDKRQEPTCEGCAFYGMEINVPCAILDCDPSERRDKKNIFFKEVDDAGKVHKE